MGLGYESLVLPYSGTSGYQKHATTLTEKQMTMVSRLEVAGQEFLSGNPPTSNRRVGMGRGRSLKAGVPDETLSCQLKEELMRKEGPKVRKHLPVHDFKAEILRHVDENQVFVLSGETGCGKTTQVTQFILDHAIQSGVGAEVSIVCTQPRRVAAISVAEWVAKERGEPIGTSVGYQVKMDSKLPRHQGSMLYCTAGILLQRLQSNRRLESFTHVILDEVHERDVMTDIVFVLLKEVLRKRSDVKVILMSATLNGSQFSQFFNDCPVLHVPGFMHPVQSFYVKEVLEMINYQPLMELTRDEDDFEAFKQSLREIRDGGDSEVADIQDYQVNIIAALVETLHRGDQEGGILVFLPGWEDICRLVRILEDIGLPLQDALILPLHGSMSGDEQRLIFQPPFGGKRKIVIATNIAESSVTIDDIVFVIDCGRAKMKMFDPTKNFATLKPEWISKANSTQRKGRAGRLRPGKVFRIYSRRKEETFREYMLPEILRTRLENVLLKVKILDYVEVDRFLVQLLDSPRTEAVVLALESLSDIGAINQIGELTALGRILANLATDPQLGKMMILGCALSCLDPILTIIAALEYKSPFFITKNRESVKAMDKLSCETMSDHLAVANAFAGWYGARMNRKKPGLENQVSDFCKDNCLSQGVLFKMEKLKAQYVTELFKLGLIPTNDVNDSVSNLRSGVESVVRAVIVTGLTPNIATIKAGAEKHSLVGCRDQPLEFHPKSVNREILTQLQSTFKSDYIPRWFVYFEKMHTSDTFLADTTSANLLTLILLAANVRLVPLPQPILHTLDKATKERLGIRGNDVDCGEFTDVRITSGEQSQRLLVCKTSDANQIEFVRSVLERIIQERIEGKEKGSSDPGSPHGKVLSLLMRIIKADSSR